MSRGGAPSKRRKDVLISAPPGIWPIAAVGQGEGHISPASPEITEKDVISMQAAQIRELQSELKMQKTSAVTIARFAICLIRMFEEHTGSNVVRVPKELFERMRGAEIQIAQPEDKGGDVFGRYVDHSGSVILPTGVIR